MAAATSSRVSTLTRASLIFRARYSSRVSPRRTLRHPCRTSGSTSERSSPETAGRRTRCASDGPASRESRFTSEFWRSAASGDVIALGVRLEEADEPFSLRPELPLGCRRDGARTARASSVAFFPLRSTLHLPATAPSTRNVGDECGVFVSKTSGRKRSGRICVPRAWTSSVASQVGRKRGGAFVEAPGSGARGRSTSSRSSSSRKRRRRRPSAASWTAVGARPAQFAASARRAGPKPVR